MKLNNLIFTALAGFSIILTGCQNNDENEQHYDNKLFISASNFTKEILFKAGDTNVETGLSVAIAKPEKHDIQNCRLNSLIQENLISKPLMCFQSLLNPWKGSAFCKVLKHIIMYSAEHHLLMWYVISVVIVLTRISRMTPNSII